jgi:sterol desaturase/sphingolipid hydroxylase (fatty acid hydroxylase superfamily)
MHLIYYAIPFFIILLTIEWWLSKRSMGKGFEGKDTITSLTMGVGNVIVGLFGKFIVFGAYALVYEYRIFELGSQWWVWFVLFFAEDLTYYIFHRASHEVRYFWASHVVHHSSEYYNLSTALRQTWTGQLSGAFVFWLWLPLMGFHPIMVLTMQTISLIYQFWIHTELIHRLPAWIEFVFNTPSHHRVHHSSEPRYLDKNHAGVLIIWDKIFGTFSQEAQDKYPVYGLTENVGTYQPMKVAFHEWVAMYKDIWSVKSWKARWKLIFGRPSFRYEVTESESSSSQ